MAKLPAGCRKFYNFCNALVMVARTLPLAAKSCELFPSSAAKDFFAVTLRQPYSKLAAGFSFSKGYKVIFFAYSYFLLVCPLSVLFVCLTLSCSYFLIK